MSEADVATSVGVPGRAHPWRWGYLRLALGVVSLTLGVLVLVQGERIRDFSDFERAVRADDVVAVRAEVARTDGSDSETVHVVVHWRTHGGRYASEEVTSSRDQLDELVEPLGGKVTVVQVGEASIDRDVLNRSTPRWLEVAVGVLSLAALLLLVAMPRPWWATRWAWFWLAGIAAPLTISLCAVLVGPFPGARRPDPDHRRIRGIWGFAVMVVLGGGLRALGWV